MCLLLRLRNEDVEQQTRKIGDGLKGIDRVQVAHLKYGIDTFSVGVSCKDRLVTPKLSVFQYNLM